jgi:hypothetical protein
LDDAQLAFMSWVLFYESVSELPTTQKPTEKVLENDELLDAWLLERETTQALGKQGSKPGERTSGAWGQGSVTVGGN